METNVSAQRRAPACLPANSGRPGLLPLLTECSPSLYTSVLPVTAAASWEWGGGEEQHRPAPCGAVQGRCTAPSCNSAMPRCRSAGADRSVSLRTVLHWLGWGRRSSSPTPAHLQSPASVAQALGFCVGRVPEGLRPSLCPLLRARRRDGQLARQGQGGQQEGAQAREEVRPRLRCLQQVRAGSADQPAGGGRELGRVFTASWPHAPRPSLAHAPLPAPTAAPAARLTPGGRACVASGHTRRTWSTAPSTAQRAATKWAASASLTVRGRGRRRRAGCCRGSGPAAAALCNGGGRAALAGGALRSGWRARAPCST